MCLRKVRRKRRDAGQSGFVSSAAAPLRLQQKAGQQSGGREVLGHLNMDTIYRAWKKKNLPAISLGLQKKKSERAQQQHLRKPHYSHLLTEASACDAVPKVAGMRRL